MHSHSYRFASRILGINFSWQYSRKVFRVDLSSSVKIDSKSNGSRQSNPSEIGKLTFCETISMFFFRMKIEADGNGIHVEIENINLHIRLFVAALYGTID